MKTKELIEKLIFKNQDGAFSLGVQIERLRTIQQAVTNLADRIENYTFQGYHKQPNLAMMSLEEIQDDILLIEMAFRPLFNEMQDNINELNEVSSELFDTFKVKNEQHSINSLLGWNYSAMENNIKTFIKEFGREPDSFEEVATYMTEISEKVRISHEENKKADAGNID